MKKLCIALVFILGLLVATTAIAQEGYYTAQSETSATINNPDPTDRLNLRTKPDAGAPTLGKYYTGTYVEVLGEEKDGWVKVRFCNLEGYMMKKYLAFDENRGLVGSEIPAVKIDNTSGTGLNLRKTQSINSKSLGLFANGETLLVYGVGETWCHVQASDGKIGFMLREKLSPVLEFDKGPGSGDKVIYKNNGDDLEGTTSYDENGVAIGGNG